MKLVPIRRRGTIDQRIRRIKKWARRRNMRSLANHFGGVLRYARSGNYRRAENELEARNLRRRSLGVAS